MKKASKNLTERQAAQAAEEKSISINVYLPPAMFNNLKKLADREAVHLSTLARQAIVKQYRREFKELEAGSD